MSMQTQSQTSRSWDSAAGEMAVFQTALLFKNENAVFNGEQEKNPLFV